jgi:hypothetical protein
MNVNAAFSGGHHVLSGALGKAGLLSANEMNVPAYRYEAGSGPSRADGIRVPN